MGGKSRRETVTLWLLLLTLGYDLQSTATEFSAQLNLHDPESGPGNTHLNRASRALPLVIADREAMSCSDPNQRPGRSEFSTPDVGFSNHRFTCQHDDGKQMSIARCLRVRILVHMLECQVIGGIP